MYLGCLPGTDPETSASQANVMTISPQTPYGTPAGNRTQVKGLEHPAIILIRSVLEGLENCDISTSCLRGKRSSSEL